MSPAEAAIAAAEEVLLDAKTVEVIEGLRAAAAQLLKLADHIESGAF